MSVLILSEDDVRRLLTMDMALEAVEAVLRKQALDEAQNIPRARVSDRPRDAPRPVGVPPRRWASWATRSTARRRKGPHFHVGLYDGKTGALLALIQADYLGQVRTGAASGVATQYMARHDAAGSRPVRHRQAGAHAAPGDLQGAARSATSTSTAPTRSAAGSSSAK